MYCAEITRYTGTGHRLVKMYHVPQFACRTKTDRKSVDFRLLMSLAYGNDTLISLCRVRGPVDHLHEAKLTLRLRSEY